MKTTAAKGDGKQAPAKAATPARGDGYSRFESHLRFDHVLSPEQATERDRFEAVARSVRDALSERWLLTQQAYDKANPKRVYYLSMEFLIGRTLSNNLLNLGLNERLEEFLPAEVLRDW